MTKGSFGAVRDICGSLLKSYRQSCGVRSNINMIPRNPEEYRSVLLDSLPTSFKEFSLLLLKSSPLCLHRVAKTVPTRLDTDVVLQTARVSKRFPSAARCLRWHQDAWQPKCSCAMWQDGPSGPGAESAKALPICSVTGPHLPNVTTSCWKQAGE